MITEVLLVTLGAVKTPLLEIVPGLADQVTAVFALPLILAENCCCPCEGTVAVPGEIEIAGAEALLVEGETTIRARFEPDSWPVPDTLPGRVETTIRKL
jgi:hypothetical protein